jgi:hypothetical protein
MGAKKHVIFLGAGKKESLRRSTPREQRGDVKCGHKGSGKPPPRSSGHKPNADRSFPRAFCFSSGRFWPEYRVTDLYLSTMKNCVLRAWLLTGPEVERHL